MEGCHSAPEEIFLALEHVHAMALCLAGVSSDLYSNPRSIVHQTADIAKVRQHQLKVHIAKCDRALLRMETLLKKYVSFKDQDISLWDKFRWSIDGKREIAECKATLVTTTIMLDMFLSKEKLNVLWKIESTIEKLTKRICALEVFDLPSSANSRERPKGGSNVIRTIFASLVLARLGTALKSYRGTKILASAQRTSRPYLQSGPRRPKSVGRTNFGFRDNSQRNALLQTYGSCLVTATPGTPQPQHPLQAPQPRAPSPDFYYITATTPSPSLRPVRRSSSMQHLLGCLNARIVVPAPPKDHYKCWKVGTGSLAFGPRIAPKFLKHRRGQTQLRKLATIIREASIYDGRSLTERDRRVELLLKEKNKKVPNGMKWYFAAGKVLERDPGRTGMVTVEKAIVVLVRR